MEDIINKTKLSVDNEIRKIFGEHTDEFYCMLQKSKSYIGGGFIFANFGRDIDSDNNYFGKVEYTDIDIFMAYDPETTLYNFLLSIGFVTLYGNPSPTTDNEEYVLDETDICYLTKDNHVINLVYAQKDNTNADDMISYINCNFDLECCKLAYNGDYLYVNNIDNLLKKQSNININYENDKIKQTYNLIISSIKSVLFLYFTWLIKENRYDMLAQFQLLTSPDSHKCSDYSVLESLEMSLVNFDINTGNIECDIFDVEKGNCVFVKKKEFNISKYMEILEYIQNKGIIDINSHFDEVNAKLCDHKIRHSGIIRYVKEIKLNDKNYITNIFDDISNPTDHNITMSKIIHTLKIFKRMKKYKKRGIKTFIMSTKKSV